jgi:hypothetical protein
MNILDDLRAEWIAMRKSLGDHIAYLEAGNKIHPIDQDPNEATIEFVGRLKQYRSDVEGNNEIAIVISGRADQSSSAMPCKTAKAAVWRA